MWKRFQLRSRYAAGFFSAPRSSYFSKSCFAATATRDTPLSACIVGSGPSGFYTAKYLLKKIPNVRISILDSLPTPFGLVRYGVAPDHAETKNVIKDFTESVLASPQVCYFGNVSLGSDVTVSRLRSIFDCVVLSFGANSNRKLGIPNESLQGIYHAREFVNWYNGHPSFKNAIDTEKDFARHETAVIIGQGNVALDCARILAAPQSRLEVTDIKDYALNALFTQKGENNNEINNKIKEIYIVGRRGPSQASFTNKELREVIDQIEGIKCTANKADFDEADNEATQEECKERAVKRKMSILERALKNEDMTLETLDTETNETKLIHFRFLWSPVEFIDNNGNDQVSGVKFQRNRLEGEANKQKCVAIENEFITIECGLVLESIGYKAVPVDDIPWNSKNNTINSVAGRVVSVNNDSGNEKGLYATGWLKRGPSGIIGTNIPDATETVNAIIEDYNSSNFEGNDVDSLQSETMLMNVLSEKKVNVVDKEGWNRIDEYEKKCGESLGKTREKMVDIDKMIEIARQS